MTGAVEALVADALALCAIPAPTFEERERALRVARTLQERGASVTRDGAGNVIARFGAADGPAAIVTAHLDTVFPAGTPLAPERDGDTLRGPGIGDNSLGLAALLHLAERLATRPAPPHPVMLVATVGEEGTGDLRGVRALLDEISCDAFVALEGHGLDTIQVAGIASARLRATFRASGGHSWGDRGTPSAVHALLVAGAAALTAAGSAHANIGVAAGGTSVNTIAAEASCEIDLRDADDAALDATRDRVEAALREGSPDGIALELERIGRRPGGATPPDHPLVLAAREARRHAGLAPAEETASSTDANAAMGRGIPAVSVSLTRGANAHRLDEHVQIGPLEQGLAAVEALVDALAAGLA